MRSSHSLKTMRRTTRPCLNRKPMTWRLAAFGLESKRIDLKKRYYTKIELALSARTAARFFQVENQILMLLDLQMASMLPVVK